MFVGDLVTIGGVTWRVLSVHDRNTPADAPPGTGAGRVAVVIEMDRPGRAPVPVERNFFAAAHDPRTPPLAPRATWVAPPGAPRPETEHTTQVPTGTQAAPRPSTRYDTTLPGQVDVTWYTDPAGQVRYVETVLGTVLNPNPVLDAPYPQATYVVHPADGRHAMVLRTDPATRLVEVTADPLAPLGSYGRASHPMTAVLGAWPARISPHHLFMSLDGPAATAFGALSARLFDAVAQGQHVTTQIQAAYDDTGPVPASFTVHHSIDGHSTTQSFPNR